MSDKPAQRRWEAQNPFTGDWGAIVSVDDDRIALADGAAFLWRPVGSHFPRLLLRYTVAVQGQWMAWKPGDLILLTQDFDRPDLAEVVRDAQSARRQERMVTHG
jgi:hypothetical protein